MKKGQAAMEYLMTYGWAILIIIVVVAALYAMGVFKVGKGTVPCSPCFSYFAYVDYSDDTLVIRNGARTITITSVTTDGGAVSIDASSDCQLDETCDPGSKIVLNSSAWTTAGDYDITITYTDVDSGLTHTDTATLHTG